jgi:hypothetical protein
MISKTKVDFGYINSETNMRCGMTEYFKNKLKVAIVGSRNFTDYGFVREKSMEY